MLQKFFLWFYCLSILHTVLLVFTITAIYLLLYRRYKEKQFFRLVIFVSLLLWVAVITIATLTDRTSAELSVAPQLIPFHSYRAVVAGENKEILRSNFMNVVLFYPAGLLAYELLPKTWKGYRKILLVTLVFAMFSVGIEVCQYCFALGQAEVDDVIHNTLGALIGAAVCTIHIPWHNVERLSINPQNSDQ